MMQQASSLRTRPGRLTGEFLLRAAVFALVWWLLTHGDAGSWAIGAPAVGAAAILSIVLMPARPSFPRLAGLPGFLLYFARESVAGGVDVVKRALHPAMPLEPDFVTISVSRLDAPHRLVFAILVSLMPGTLSARLQGETLRVHVLDRRMPVEASLQRLEDALAGLIGRAPRGKDGT